MGSYKKIMFFLPYHEKFVIDQVSLFTIAGYSLSPCCIQVVAFLVLKYMYLHTK